MYPPLPASDVNNVSDGIDFSNESNYAARNSSMNADTDGDEESVVAEENEDQMQEKKRQFITLVNNKKSMVVLKARARGAKRFLQQVLPRLEHISELSMLILMK